MITKTNNNNNNKSKKNNDSKNEISSWETDSLYDYVRDNFLNNTNNTNNNNFLGSFQNLKHMIIDPENYLNNYTNLTEAFDNLIYLSDKYNIFGYIFIISHIKLRKNKTVDDLQDETDRFTTKFCYLIKRENGFFEDNMTITTIFFIKDNQIQIKPGRALRETISDEDISKIINNRRKNLINQEYNKVINDLTNDIINTYETNFKYYNSFFYKNKKMIFTSIFIFLSTFILLYGYSTYVPESEREEKIQNFLERNGRKKIFKIFYFNCLICLNKFMSEQEKNNIENILDKTVKKREKTVRLSCGHVFHKICINEWKKFFKDDYSVCPFCLMRNNYNEAKIDIKKGKKKILPLSFVNNDSNNKDFNRNNFDEIKLENAIEEFLEIQRKAFPHLFTRDHFSRVKKNYFNYKEEQEEDETQLLDDD